MTTDEVLKIIHKLENEVKTRDEYITLLKIETGNYINKLAIAENALTRISEVNFNYAFEVQDIAREALKKLEGEK
jgi:hypothetical protein